MAQTVLVVVMIAASGGYLLYRMRRTLMRNLDSGCGGACAGCSKSKAGENTGFVHAETLLSAKSEFDRHNGR